MLSRSDRTRSWEWFERSLRADVDDLQQGTTPEGIHLGAMAGTVDLAQRCYTGVEMRDDVLWLNPRLPDELVRLRLTLRYRAHWLRLEIGDGRLTVSFQKGWSSWVEVGFRETIYTFHQGDTRVFDLDSGELLEEDISGTEPGREQPAR